MRASLATAKDLERLKAPVFEVKYDGFRALAALSGQRLELWTRNRLDLAGRFPELARALLKVEAPEAVLDGEIVALDGRQVSRFELLFEPRAPRRYVAFDLLWLDGQDLRGRPLDERRGLLEALVERAGPLLLLAERLVADTPREALRRARARGVEGVVAKERAGRYRAGSSHDWRKVKLTATQELAIVGYTPMSTGEQAVGALLLAVRSGSSFEYAGKVGTGFSDEQRRTLREALDEDLSGAAPPARAPRERGPKWVRPRYVAQVRFAEWTRDGRLRHPVFLGLRPDRTPADCVRELPEPGAR